eukprot:366522-Chlamydomonas_euryale.AAC.5
MAINNGVNPVYACMHACVLQRMPEHSEASLKALPCSSTRPCLAREGICCTCSSKQPISLKHRYLIHSADSLPSDDSLGKLVGSTSPH